MVMVRGRWQGREQGKVIATTIEDLKLATIWIKPKHENPPTLERLKQILTKSDGAIPVRLLYERTGKGVALPLQKYSFESNVSFSRQVEALLGKGSFVLREI